MEMAVNNSKVFSVYREGLGPYAKISFAIHFLLLITFIAGPRTFKFLRPKTSITPILPAIRVDVVGMPKLTLQELKKLSSGSAGEGAKEASSEGINFQKEGRTKKLSDLLNSEANKDLSLKPSSKTKGKKEQGKLGKDLSKLVLEGNKISKGMAIIGDTRALVMESFGQYVSSIPDYVRPNWKLPVSLMNSKFNCRIRIYIDSQGKLEKAEIFETSGNQEYDRRALQAVMSSTFPKPDKEILEKVTSGQILLGFPL